MGLSLFQDSEGIASAEANDNEFHRNSLKTEKNHNIFSPPKICYKLTFSQNSTIYKQYVKCVFLDETC